MIFQFFGASEGPGSTPTIDSWKPVTVDQPRPATAKAAFAAATIAVFTSALVAEVVTIDKWFVANSQPRRPEPIRASIPSAFFTPAAPFPETVSLDRWMQPLSVRDTWFKGGLPSALQQSVAFVPLTTLAAETILLDKWYQPPSQPKYIKPVEQPDSAINIFYQAQPLISIGWMQPQSQPRRWPLSQADQQFYTFGGPPQVMDWYEPPSQPRQPRPFEQTLFQAYTAVVTAPITVPGIDSWGQPTNQPRPIRPTADQFGGPSFVPNFGNPVAPSLATWFQPLSLPRKQKGQFQTQTASGEPPGNRVAPLMSHWYSLPVDRQHSAKAGQVSQPLTMQVTASPPPTVTMDMWFQPNSQRRQPIRQQMAYGSVDSHIRIVVPPYQTSIRKTGSRIKVYIWKRYGRYKDFA